MAGATSPAPDKTTAWPRAAGWALAIFAYFVLFTVWLPSWVLHLSAVAAAPDPVRQLIGSGVWLIFLGSGMWVLRRIQARGSI
jgi:hypothetical protein